MTFIANNGDDTFPRCVGAFELGLNMLADSCSMMHPAFCIDKQVKSCSKYSLVILYHSPMDLRCATNKWIIIIVKTINMISCKLDNKSKVYAALRNLRSL